MTPPGGSNGNNRNAGGEVVPFARLEAARAAKEAKLSEAPPESSPRSSDRLKPASLRMGFYDFGTLMRTVQGTQLPNSQGPYGRIQTYLDFLANPLINGGHDVTFTQGGKSYRLRQKGPGQAIEVLHREGMPTKKGAEASQKNTPVFAITYHPDGKVSHSANFDDKGQAKAGKTRTLQELGAHRFDHTYTLQFLEARLNHLGKGQGAYTRLKNPLAQIRGRADSSGRSIWYDNLIVLKDKVYSLKTQNLSYATEVSVPSQTQIVVYENTPNGLVEVLRTSQTGEFAHNPKQTTRRLGSIPELNLLKDITGQVLAIHDNPKAYQKKLDASLGKQKAKFKAPPIEIIPVAKVPTTTRGSLNEPIFYISRGMDLLKLSLPFWPLPARSHRYQNPSKPEDVRQLRPKGAVHRGMFNELLRWSKRKFIKGTASDVFFRVPPAGSMRLQLLPDGSSQLDIYRKIESRGTDGSLTTEKTLYNIIHRSADGTTVDLDKIIKKMLRNNPELRDKPRIELIKMANRSQGQADVSFFLFNAPEIPIERLPNGPKLTTATGAWEILQSLPELQDLKSEVRREQHKVEANTPKSKAGIETSLEIHYPGSNPPTYLQINEGTGPNQGRRVTINVFQTGRSTATAVYDGGILNQPESIRINEALFSRAQQGHHRFGKWRVPKFLWYALTRGQAFRIAQGASYVFGHYGSLPAAWAYEQLAFTPGMRKLIGTPSPTLQGLGHEMAVGGAMLTAAGYASSFVDYGFNFSSGMMNARQVKLQSGVTMRQALKQYPFRLLGPPPLSARPIPKQAYYVRNFMQRSIPLLAGLMAADMVYRKSWIPRLDGEIMTTAYRVGAVSGATSLAWAGVQHRLEAKLARSGSARASSFLLRHNILKDSLVPIGRSRFIMSWRANVATIILEMAALKIWDSYDRRQQLLAQEGTFRTDLSRAIDQRNRLMSRLESQEDIPPTRLLNAEHAVQGAYTRYRRYLEILERGSADKTEAPDNIELNNAYSDARRDYQTQRSILAQSGSSNAGQELLKLQLAHDLRLGTLHGQEQKFENRIQVLYKSDKTDNDNGEEESLRDFLARTTKILEANPDIVDSIANPSSSPTTLSHTSTISLASTQGRIIIQEMRAKIQANPDFAFSEQSNQAQWLHQTFTGFHIQEADGSQRPWTENDANAFLISLNAENTRRANNLEATLLTPIGGQQLNPELERLAKQEEQIYDEELGHNQHELLVRNTLAHNIEDLDLQLEKYEAGVQERIDYAILQFMPGSEGL